MSARADSLVPPIPLETVSSSPRPSASLSARELFRLARPAAGRLLLSVGLAAIATLSGIALLATSGWLISRSSQRPPESDLGLAVAGVQLFALSRGFARYGERLVGHDGALAAMAELRARVYRQLERLAPAGLRCFGRSDLMARLVHDVDALQELVLRVFSPYAVALLAAVPVVAFLWLVLPGAGAVLLTALVLAATLVPWLARRAARRSEARLADYRAELTSAIVDLMQGYDELKAYGAIEQKVTDIERANGQLTRVARSAARTSGLGTALTTGLVGLAMVGSLVLGVRAVAAGSMSGVLLAVVAFVPLATTEMVIGLPAAAQLLEQLRGAGARVRAVMEAPEPVDDPAQPVPVPPSPWKLSARSMGAAYPGGPPVLDDVDLELAPAAHTAVIGPSGSGKSTLALVLTRLLVPSSGGVSLNEVDLELMLGDHLRRVVGLAAQDAHIFDATIAANLRLAQPGVTDAGLWEVLSRVGLAAWVREQPSALHTEVGEHGRWMSGGQRQRLSVARALLADFPLLILDEPVEHLDPSAAAALEAEIIDCRQGRSTILVTHRMDALSQFDEVLVMERGRVVERGTHRRLVDADGLYSAFWQRVERSRAVTDPVNRQDARGRELEAGGPGMPVR